MWISSVSLEPICLDLESDRRELLVGGKGGGGRLHVRERTTPPAPHEVAGSSERAFACRRGIITSAGGKKRRLLDGEETEKMRALENGSVGTTASRFTHSRRRDPCLHTGICLSWQSQFFYSAHGIWYIVGRAGGDRSPRRKPPHRIEEPVSIKPTSIVLPAVTSTAQLKASWCRRCDRCRRLCPCN